MKYLPFTVFSFYSVLFRLALSLSPTYIDCQLQKPPGESPLAGCPDGTIYVSSTDHTYANFSAVQEAIDSLPDTGNATILIGQGSYFEMLNVSRSAPLTLLGQLGSATGNTGKHNLVRIWNKRYAGNGVTDEETATLFMAASIGNAFGNVDFRAYNINFENRAANYAISQALVTAISHTNASFYGCAFASFQDTWYTGSGANTFVVDSVVFGQTDYLFGSGIAWFQSVVLANQACGGGITAWRGTPGTNNGVYIADSRIIRSPDANSTTVTTERCYLGRPWNEYAVAIFLRNYMDDSIRPARFKPWTGETSVPNTTYYAEFDSHGPGGNTSARVPQDHILTAAQAARFTVNDVFDGVPSWIDFEYQY